VGNAVIGLVADPGRIVGGTIFFLGRQLALDRETKGPVRRGRDIGVIFQDPLTSLNPLFSIESQISENMRFHKGMGPNETRRRALELIDAVGIPDPVKRLRQYPHHLSGGMQQRVVIAMALSCGPKLIIADEPTTALDVSIRTQILDLVKKLCKERGVGVLLVSHDIGLISETVDNITVMYQGEVVETGATADILGRPEHAYTRSLMAAVPRIDVKLERFPHFSRREDSIPSPEKSVSSQITIEDVPTKEQTILEVQHISVDYSARNAIFARRAAKFRAVDAASFTIAQGEIFGLVGESGSGKSTLASVITGLLSPSEGRVLFLGDVWIESGRKAITREHRRQMQMIFQDPYSSLNDRMRIGDTVAEPIRFHGLAGSRQEARERVKKLLSDVGLSPDMIDRYPHAFSGGERQRISIARALATRPRFIVCDEPTSALDVSIQAQVLNLLKDLRDAYGLTLLIISHDLPVVRQMCDRVAVMRTGRLCEVADTDRLFTEPEHDYTKNLLSLVPRLGMLARIENLYESQPAVHPPTDRGK
jgi:peptide/nickel transport system ATP-binding protein